MEKKWNKKYIADSLRTVYTGLVSTELQFKRIEFVVQPSSKNNSILKLIFKKRNENRIRTLYLWEGDADYQLKLLYKRNVVYNPYKGRAW